MIKKNIMILVLCIGLLFCSSVSIHYSVNNMILKTEKNVLITKLDQSKIDKKNLIQKNNHLKDSIAELLSFNQNNVKRLMKLYDIKHPEIVFKQATLETGNFTSRIFADNNNLFGMKEARIRATTSTGTAFGHATYRSYIDSIKDYKLWQLTLYDEDKYDSDYFAFLNAIGYAEDKKYIRKLKN